MVSSINYKFTQYERRKTRKYALKMFCVLFLMMVMIAVTGTVATAATGFKIYDYSTKKTTMYTDMQVTVTYNGETINNTPGIIQENIALVPYDEIFQNSSILAECSYDKKNNTIIISKYGITIKMEIGTTKATVNGKAVTLPVAPMKVKYIKSKKVKILIPSRYVSETLGLGYTWDKSTRTVSIENNSIQLAFNNDESFAYTGALCNVSIDGETIDLGGMPSIITNNTAMVRAKRVFSDSIIDADYQYNKSKKTVTINKDDITLVMTMGSKEAKLNDDTITLDTAPIVVMNYETNTSYVMVPGSFTASSLGYDYQWNNATRTSVITSVSEDSGQSIPDEGSSEQSTDADTAPELGDANVVNETGSIVQSWTAQEGFYGHSSGIHEINGNGSTSSESGVIYSVSSGNTNLYSNQETVVLVANKPFTKVSADKAERQLTVSIAQMSCVNQTSQLYGITSYMINYVSLMSQTNQTESILMIDMVQADYNFDLSLSADGLTLTVTIYKNVLINAVIGMNSTGDYITLTGIEHLNALVSVQSNVLCIDLPYTVNNLGNINHTFMNTKYVNQLIINSSNDRTIIYITMKSDYIHYILENGNQYTVSFQDRNSSPGIITPPVDPSQASETNEADNAADNNGNTESETADSTEPADISPILPREIPMVTDANQYQIIMPRPQGLTSSMVTDEDYYFKKYFEIRLQGNYTDLISNASILNASDSVKEITISLNSSNETVIKFNTTKLQGYTMAWDEANIYIRVGNPREIYNRIVVLDPGHGGEATGALYYGVKEKDVNFDILYKLGRKYFDSDSDKLKVYYTRTTDTDLALSQRAAFVKTVGADLFISLHMNASELSSVNGTEVYYSSKNNSANSAGLTSKKLATYFFTHLTTELGTTKRSVKSADYTVIYKNTVPAVLIELGFLSNQKECNKLTDITFQTNAAKTIYDTILRVFNDYPTGR